MSASVVDDEDAHLSLLGLTPSAHRGRRVVGGRRLIAVGLLLRLVHDLLVGKMI